MAKVIYKTSFDGMSYYVDGPASGGQCSYYGGYLYPGSRFEKEEYADKTATLMNMAYEEGYNKAMSDVRTLLKIKK